MEINLLSTPATTATTPFEVAEARAQHLFRSQLATQDVKLNEITSAALKIITHPQEVNVVVNERVSGGYMMEFTAIALDSKNRAFQFSSRIKVARHDSEIETRSGSIQ